MKSLCTTCKDKVACDAHRRCYGYPNYRVSECIGYEPKDEPQTEMVKCYKCRWWNYSYGCGNPNGICKFEELYQTERSE